MRPICSRLFETAPTLLLYGGRERESGRFVFPPPESERFERVALPRSGTLWSYTVQRMAPKSPPYRGSKPFEPFALGYVDLPNACIVETRLAETAIEDLRVGLPMELTTLPLWTDDEGVVICIYAFRGVVSDSRHE